jgi:hypothetical protein
MLVVSDNRRLYERILGKLDPVGQIATESRPKVVSQFQDDWAIKPPERECNQIVVALLPSLSDL